MRRFTCRFSVQYYFPPAELAAVFGEKRAACEGGLSMVIRWDHDDYSYTIDTASLRLDLTMSLDDTWHIDLVRALESLFGK